MTTSDLQRLKIPVVLSEKGLVARITASHPTPFYLYDEDGIRRRCRELLDAFSWNAGFRQFFAVKAAPNPHIVAILAEEGCGADCSSIAELVLCDRLGLKGSSVIFTSNNTTLEEFQKAAALGAIVNLDTPDHIGKLRQLSEMPEVIAFRYNPGPQLQGNVLIGSPAESKFGCTKLQILEGYSRCRALGYERFGLHAMVVSNELRLDSLLSNAEMLFQLAVEIRKETGVAIEFINLGGGVGIPYKPQDRPVDLGAFGSGVQTLFEKLLVPNGLGDVMIMTENGRAMTGPFGYLVTRVINVKQSYKRYVGVDACMSNLMRPGMYGAYHHISVLGKETGSSEQVVDVVGSLCENNDKFAVDRRLPQVEPGDIALIHDVGAHGHCMGFQYNGRLRSAEFLFNDAGHYRCIRRAESLDDYFATIEFPGVAPNCFATADRPSG